ncbi:MAG: type III pantothenate kinase [Geminicoccaceae bacterium]|nr:type III pantothenate kinase [Geminicoccaceae bacterium]
MLLLIDVGNTNTVFALYRERKQLGQWRLSTNRERTAEEYGALLIQLIQIAGFDHRQVAAVIISSVVPPALQPLRWMSEGFFGCKAFVTGEDLEHGIVNKLNNPREAGSDRLVNAVAAVRRYEPPLIIVDFGTATTFDVVDNEGAFIGGVIAPGINLSIEALHRAAAKLPRIAIEPPANAIGRSTEDAMQSGIFWGYVGMIEGLIARIEAEYGASMTVIATGGLAPLFARQCACLKHVDKDLTMAGLLEIYLMNRERIHAGEENGDVSLKGTPA